MMLQRVSGKVDGGSAPAIGNDNIARLQVTLVDPSLFTAPYDSGLHSGLIANAVDPVWLARPLRPGERAELPANATRADFYRFVERSAWLPRPLRGPIKGLSHIAGLGRLLAHTLRQRPAVVHFQWTMVPLLDWVAIVLLKALRVPVVLTVHDANPFNGEKMTLLQKLGFHLPIRAADRVIVHTEAARRTLLGFGNPDHKIAIADHGPLLAPSLPPGAVTRRDARVSFTIFGQIKAYKGVDLIIEAVGRLTPELQAGMRVIVAGAAHIDIAPLIARAAELGIREVIDFRIGRLSEDEMALLFAETDVFLFPYRVIDASGVYYMVRSLGRWMIASRVGVFAEDFVEGEDGRLIPPEDVGALALAMAEAIDGRPPEPAEPRGSSWAEIGRVTRDVYLDAMHA